MRSWKTLASLICGVASALQSAAAETLPPPVMTAENDYAKIAVAADGQNLHFIDRRQARWCGRSAASRGRAPTIGSQLP